MGKKHDLLLECIIALVYISLSIGCSIKAPTSEQKKITPSNQENQIDATNTSTDTILPIDALKFEEAIYYPKCISPCWIGIEAGVTSYGEAEAILQQRYGKLNTEVKPNSMTWVSDGVDVSRGGGLTFSDGIVDSVRVWFGGDRLTVDDLIGIIDQPESVRIAKAFSSKANCAGASLFYLNLGIEVWLSPEGSFVGVKRSQFIDSIIFLSPHLLNDWQVTDSILTEWDGYHDYCPESFDAP